MKKSVWSIFCLLALTISTASAAGDRAVRAAGIRREATISYSRQYEVACAPELV